MSPIEHRAKVDQLGAESDPLLAQWMESYEALRRERVELSERVERLEAELARRAPSKQRTRPRSRIRALVTNALFGCVCLLAAAALATMVAVIGGLYRLGPHADPAGATAAGTPGQVPQRRGVPSSASAPVGGAERARETARLAGSAPMLRLTAQRGPSWLQVRRDSREGDVLYEGALGAGRSVSFGGERLFVRLGAPGNLEAEIDGEPVTKLPANTVDVVVDEGGLRVVSVG